jgi:GNAT superfamily N-acetyltransferase
MSSLPEFEQLFRQENDLLCQADQGSTAEILEGLETESPGPAGEPWVCHTSIDRVGLAFSGGGIRSATFNLGVLKALHEIGALKYVDYLSTVSGGGYIGAWWSAWRTRAANKGKGFPLAHRSGEKIVPDEKLNREPEEVRHLREFSNFLSPRIGFFQSETWNAVIAVLSAVLPAMLVASSVIAVAFLIWLGFSTLILADALNMPTWARSWWKWPLTPLLLSVITIVAYVCLELSWKRAGKAEAISSKKGRTWAWVVMPLIMIAGFWLAWPLLARVGWMNPQPNGDSLWKWATGIAPNGGGFSFSPHLFSAPILWVAVALTVFLPRMVIMRPSIVPVTRSGKIVSATDRALSRMLGAAVVLAMLAVLWLAGCWLKYTDWGTEVPAGGALISGGAFALLRNWIGRFGPSKKGGIMDLIKPLIPQILAYIAIALWAICIAVLLATLIDRGVSPWVLCALALGIIAGAMVLFDPAQVSMHSFYRNRLSRAYLGASNPEAAQSSERNRQTDVRRTDDVQLRDLSPSDAVRPIHLVCCAANDLAGDHLANLSRGSRSAVLSRFGFAIGNYWHSWDKEAQENRESLGLGSAITASAAAFNSNMGSISMTLGAGVTFLCTALNLRLGLWLPHPLTDKDGAPTVLPGLLFFKEMFGLTNSGLRPPPATGPRKPVANYVHLSDGAHFENLGLYELVRRHCRYVIVSDCGADPNVAFDDFGNAVRRIREDFGVEIEIDLTPLKPDAARLSKQHVAVGTITYDPRGDRKDSAILLYIKPTLTGDEPCDISQYRTRNENFPHEATGDQFYDESQWESYRRLGEHATRSALRFIERERRKEDLSPDSIFNGARWEWYQSLERREEKILELTGRLSVLEQELRLEAPTNFIREMYPELGAFGQKLAEAPQPEEMDKTLHFLTQMIQLMEDAWFAASLDTYWNDPNNLGWMNTFQRWAYTPSFRLWWPILKPMYGRKFRRFMEERLSLADEDYPPTMETVKNRGSNLPSGVAQVYWRRMHPDKQKAGTKIYTYDLELTQQREGGDNSSHSVQAGLAFLEVKENEGKKIATWTTEDFFVPPSLWGAGLGAKFLDKLLEVLRSEKISRCEVSIKPPDNEQDVPKPWLQRTDLASRQQLNDAVAFYQRAHFNLDLDKQLVRVLTLAE